MSSRGDNSPFYSPIGTLVEAQLALKRQPPYADLRALDLVAAFQSHQTKALQWLTGAPFLPADQRDSPLAVLEHIDTFSLNDNSYTTNTLDALDALDLVAPYAHVILAKFLEGLPSSLPAIQELLKRSRGLASCDEDYKRDLLARAVERGCAGAVQGLLELGVDASRAFGDGRTQLQNLVVRVASYQALNPIAHPGVVEGFVKTAELLVEHGATVERGLHRSYTLPRAFAEAMDRLQAGAGTKLHRKRARGSVNDAEGAAKRR
jgi:hypothetical protein